MTSNSLGEFYSIPDRWQLHSGGCVHVSWKCDRHAIIEIGEAGNLDLKGLCLSNLYGVNDYFDRQTKLDPLLATGVIDQLYQAALQPEPPKFNRNCWYNFIAVMTAKAARHIWQKIPPAKQSEELFHRLITPTLSVQTLLAGFNPQHQPDLLVGLHAWTYKVVKYNTYADIRANGDPYFGLSNLGIVARSSYKSMRIAMAGNIDSTYMELYISICKVFKTYLGRSKVSANKVELSHWQAILAELKLMEIEILIDELQGSIDRVGNLVRADSTPPIDSYDDTTRCIAIGDLASSQLDAILPTFDEPDPILGELLEIVDRFINSLSTEVNKIVFLRHARKLKQREIGEFIAKDAIGIEWEQLSQSDIDKLIHNHGSRACRQLQRVYSNLLDRVYTEMENSNGLQGNKNSLAIDAAKHLIEQYYLQTQSSNLT
jgi:hypothetical protein